MGDFANKKIAEAKMHIHQAEKCLKTSFFKWKEDLDGAASEYTKAAVCYRNAKCLQEAKDMYIKAAETQQKMNAPFHAAKSFEQAGLICKDNDQVVDAINLMEYAAKLFQENGTPDTAALTLDKAAKIIERSHPTKASELYRKACDMSEIEDKTRQCAEFIGKSARLLVNLQRYDDAIVDLKKEIEFFAAVQNYPSIGRIVVGIVLVYLQQGDPVAAEQFFTSAIDIPGFGDSEEAELLERMIGCYNEGDEEGLKMALASPLIKFMDNAFAKLARIMDMPVSFGSKKSNDRPTESTINNGIGSQPATKAQLDDEDFEGGLC